MAMHDWLQGKSAKMWVNEICVKQMRRPEFQVREAHPGQQPPTFICMCTIRYTDKTLESEGQGRTKKEAEQEAALEMLKNRLGMTPAMLQSLNNASKKKSGGTGGGGGSGSSSLSGSTMSVSSDAGQKGGEGDVSDTDDAEINEAVNNPVSDLMAICDQQEFQEPDFQDVNQEGPPHKRIFTVSCTISDLSLTTSGRRYTKKVAKRVAAFRALRDVKKRGYKYTPHSEDTSLADDGVQAMDEDLVQKMGAVALSTNGSALREEDLARFQQLGLKDKMAEQRSSKFVAAGRRLYCNDESETCVAFCVQYAHTFQHLKKSETLDKILLNPNLDCYDEFGGPIAVLEQIAVEMGLGLRIYRENIGADSTQGGFSVIELKFPFPFKKSKVPNKAIVHGVGMTEAEQTRNAAKKAINLLHNTSVTVNL